VGRTGRQDAGQEAGVERSELESEFEFSPNKRAHNHAASRSKVAHAVSEHVADEHGEDEPSGEGGAHEKGEEKCVDENFVCEGIEQGAEVCTLVEARGKVAVENISDEGKPEEKQAVDIAAWRGDKHAAQQGHKQLRAKHSETVRDGVHDVSILPY